MCGVFSMCDKFRKCVGNVFISASPVYVWAWVYHEEKQPAIYIAPNLCALGQQKKKLLLKKCRENIKEKNPWDWWGGGEKAMRSKKMFCLVFSRIKKVNDQDHYDDASLFFSRTRHGRRNICNERKIQISDCCSAHEKCLSHLAPFPYPLVGNCF